MMYFDNGATTYPKPPTVLRAMTLAMRDCGANPGRSGHRMSLRAAEIIYRCRESVAQLFDFDKPEQVVFTCNCTAALNTVIKGVLHSGDHAVISSLEHNAVLRPLEKLREKGVTYSVAEVTEGDDEATIRAFRSQFRKNTRLVICTHASNVFGVRLPAERLAALCRLNGILFCLDAAQTAGVVPVSLKDSCIDFLCTAGHKGLYGPMGTGVLLVNSDTVPDSLIEGGTGSFSSDKAQPSVLPDRFESGTPNLPGIAGLNAGVRFVLDRSPGRIEAYEMRLAQRFYDRLDRIGGVRLYTARPEAATHVPVISFNIGELDSEKVAAMLDRNGVAVRAGLHCAPLAHKSYGTQEQGTVRAVMSAFNQERQIDAFAQMVKIFAKQHEKKVAIRDSNVLE